MPGSAQKGRIGFNLYLPDELHRLVKVRAAVTETSMTRLITRYCWEGYERDTRDDRPGDLDSPPLPGPVPGQE